MRDVMIDFSGALFGVGIVYAVCEIKKHIARKESQLEENDK